MRLSRWFERLLRLLQATHSIYVKCLCCARSISIPEGKSRLHLESKGKVDASKVAVELSPKKKSTPFNRHHGYCIGLDRRCMNCLKFNSLCVPFQTTTSRIVLERKVIAFQISFMRGHGGKFMSPQDVWFAQGEFYRDSAKVPIIAGKTLRTVPRNSILSISDVSHLERSFRRLPINR